MAKFIIRYNSGHGDVCEEIEANDMEEAEKHAYEAWREAAEYQAEYEAMEYTEQLAEKLL